MNDNKVFVETHPLAVLFGMQHKNIARLLRQREFSTMQCVMKRLCHFEEIVSPCDDFPARFDRELIQQRHESIQHLRYTATHRGRVNHLHPFPLDGTGEKSQFIELGLADDRLVIRQSRCRRSRWWDLGDSRFAFFSGGWGGGGLVLGILYPLLRLRRGSIGLWRVRTAQFLHACASYNFSELRFEES